MNGEVFMNNITYFTAALTALFTALVGGYAAWRKLKPETASIQITSADKLVAIATSTAELINADRANLAVQVDQLRRERDEETRRLTDRLDAIEQRASEAERRADRVARELVQERAHRESLADQLGTEREKVRNLSVVVGALRRELQKHNIEVPDHLDVEFTVRFGEDEDGDDPHLPPNVPADT